MLDAFERDYIVSSGHLLSPPPNGAVILVLGERVQTIPWETLSLLQDKNVCRMPSLTFMAAHKHMVSLVVYMYTPLVLLVCSMNRIIVVYNNN